MSLMFSVTIENLVINQKPKQPFCSFTHEQKDDFVIISKSELKDAPSKTWWNLRAEAGQSCSLSVNKVMYIHLACSCLLSLAVLLLSLQIWLALWETELLTMHRVSLTNETRECYVTNPHYHTWAEHILTRGTVQTSTLHFNSIYLLAALQLSKDIINSLTFRSFSGFWK